MMDPYVTFLVLTFVAEVIGTIGGFGSSVFFVPLAGFFFGYEQVLGITAVFHVASNLAKIVLFKKGLNKYLLLYLGVPAVVFVVLGSLLSGVLVSTYFEIILGVFLVVFSGFLLLKEHVVITPNKKKRLNRRGAFGFCCGFIGHRRRHSRFNHGGL